MEDVGVRFIAQGFDDFQGTMTAATKSVEKFGEAAGGFSLQFDIFSSGIKEATSAVKGMAPGLDTWSKAMKDAQTQTVNFTSTSKNVTEFKSTFSATTREISSSTDSAKTSIINFGGAIKGIAGAVGGFAGGAVVSTISGIAGAAGKAASGLADMGKAALGTAASGLKTVGSLALDAAGALASLGLKAAEAGVNAAKGFTVDSVKVYTDFSQKISGIAAVAGATSEELQQMSDKALELGAKFPVSASQAADAMANLASAGFKAKDTIAAADSVVLLATAGQLDMAKSADILSSAMNGFNLVTNDTATNVKNAAHVTDLMAATANASAVSIQDIGATMKYVAPVAQAAGFSIEDMSKAIGLMGNAGIKGSSAGTALRSIITRLAAPTAESAAAMETLGLKMTDASGKARPFQDILLELRSKFGKLSQVQQVDLAKKLGGQEAMAGLLAMVNASPEAFDNMSKSIDEAGGAASDMAAVMSDNLNGKLQNMQGSIETLQIKFGKALAPAIGAVYDEISDLANKLGPFADQLAPKVSLAVDKVKTTVDGLSKGWGIFKGAFSSGFTVPPGWDGLVGTMGRLGTALAPLKGAVSDLITAILPEPAIKFSDSIGGVAQAAQDAHLVIDGIATIVNTVLVPGIEKAAQVVDTMQLAFSKVQGAIGPAMPTLTDLAGKALAIYQAVSPLNIALDVFTGIVTGGLPGGIDALGQHVVDLGKVFGVDLSDPVNTVTGFIKTDLIPGIGTIAQTIMDTAPKVIKFGQDFLDQVLPPIQSFIGWLDTNVSPVVNSAFDTFQTVVLPALGRFGDFIKETVLPRVGDLVNFIGEKVKPIFEKGFEVLSTTVIPTIGNLVSVITDNVIPTLMSWWSIIGTVLEPIISFLADVITTVVLPAIQKIWGFINDPLIPIFKNLANIANTVVLPAVQGIANFFNEGLHGAIDKIISIWNDLIDRFGNGADAIGKLFSGDIPGAFDAFSKAAEGTKNKINVTWDDTTKSSSDLAKNIENDTASASSSWGTAATDIGTSSSNIQTAAGNVSTATSGMATNVQGDFNKVGTTVKNQNYTADATAAGKTISQGLMAGISAMAAAVASAASNVAQGAINSAKRTLSSASPSKVFIGIGEDVSLGFAIGITNQGDLPSTAIGQVIDGVLETVEIHQTQFEKSLDYVPYTFEQLAPSITSFKPKITGAITDLTGTMGQIIEDNTKPIEDQLHNISFQVDQTGQDIADKSTGPGSPADAMSGVLDAVGKVIDSYTTILVQKLTDLLNRVNQILAAITSAVNQANGTQFHNYGDDPVSSHGPWVVTNSGNGNNSSAASNGLIPAFASGIQGFRGGMAFIADRGPEMVNLPSGQSYLAAMPTVASLPAGTDILSAPATRGMLQGKYSNYSPAATGGQIYNSTTSYTDARQYNLSMQSMRSTENIAIDFRILETLS